MNDLFRCWRLCNNSEDFLWQCRFFFPHKIVDHVYSYGNHGHLRERGSALQLCMHENMPENNVPGLWTYLHCSTLDRSYCLTNRLENRLLIPNDNPSLWGRPLLESSNPERLSRPWLWHFSLSISLGKYAFFSLSLSREHLNGQYTGELTITLANNLLHYNKFCTVFRKSAMFQ